MDREDAAPQSDDSFGSDAASGGSDSDAEIKDGDMVDGLDMLQSSDDDDAKPRGAGRAGNKRVAPQAAPEPSHAGMALASRKRRLTQGSGGGAGELDGLSVQEQEALALRMLRNR